MTKEERAAEQAKLAAEKVERMNGLTKEMLLSNGIVKQLEVVLAKIKARPDEDIRLAFFGGADEIGILVKSEKAAAYIQDILSEFIEARNSSEEEIRKLS